MTHIHYELLPIEVDAPDIIDASRAQLIRGTSLTDLVADPLEKIREAAAKAGSEDDYIQVSRAIHEAFKGLEYLAALQKNPSLPDATTLPNIKAQLQAMLEQLSPTLEKIVKKREAACKDLGPILKKAIDTLEKELFSRIQMLLESRKIEQKEQTQVHSVFKRYFKRLRDYADPILAFVAPRMAEWNTKALSMGRGLLIDSIPDLPCSILFSLKGECRLIFEDIGPLSSTQRNGFFLHYKFLLPP